MGESCSAFTVCRCVCLGYVQLDDIGEMTGRADSAIDPHGNVFDADDNDPANSHVTVSSGLYHDRVPLAGSTVAAIRRRLADRLDIDPNATAVIDGDPVRDEDATSVRAGQLLAFVRFAGEKGTSCPRRLLRHRR